MNIKIWGLRGSISVSGCEYKKYGGDTTCLEVRSGSGDVIIIDGGTGIRACGNSAIKEGLREFNLLFTHFHWDHVLGFPFFRPLYRDDVKMRIFGHSYTKRPFEKHLFRVMDKPYFPVALSNLSRNITFKNIDKKKFRIGSMEVSVIELNHPNHGLGYRFSENGKDFVFLTDNELSHKHHGGCSVQEYMRFCEGADLLIHDSEFTPQEYVKYYKGWGHSNYADVVEMATAAGVKRLGLCHHNQNHSDAKIDGIVDECLKIIKEKHSRMQCFAAAQNQLIKF